MLERVDRGPVLFAGDLTDRGSPLVRERVVDAGRPFVFVSVTHELDFRIRRLADRGRAAHRARPAGASGAAVHGQGRCRRPLPAPQREYGDYDPDPTPAQQAAFTAWAAPRS